MFTLVIKPQENSNKKSYLKSILDTKVKYHELEHIKLFRHSQNDQKIDFPEMKDQNHDYPSTMIAKDFQSYVQGCSLNKSSTILCIIGIPTLKINLNQFIKEQIEAGFQEHIDQNFDLMALEQSSLINAMSSLIIKMKTQDAADKFYSAFNGRYFQDDDQHGNSQEIMHTIYLSDILVEQAPSQLKYNEKVINQAYQNLNKEANSFYFEELPTCAICIELIDSSSSGLQFCMLNEMHGHNGHSQQNKQELPDESELIESKQFDGLNKFLWPFLDQKCLVCRDQNTYMTPPRLLEGMSALQSQLKCSQCENRDNLWICLVCAFVGCGRYHKKHAVDHFDETSHTFSIELNSQRIWNYRADYYVHRIIKTNIGGGAPPRDLQLNSQNSSEELAQIPHREHQPEERKTFYTISLPHQQNQMEIEQQQQQNSQQKLVSDRFLVQKIQGTIMEYNYLLTSQLEEQRNNYDKKLQQMAEESQLQNKGAIEEFERQKIEKQGELEQLRKKTDAFKKHIQELENKNKGLQKQITKSEQDLSFNQEILKSLELNDKQNNEDPAASSHYIQIQKMKKQIQLKKQTMEKIDKENEEIMNCFK